MNRELIFLVALLATPVIAQDAESGNTTLIDGPATTTYLLRDCAAVLSGPRDIEKRYHSYCMGYLMALVELTGNGPDICVPFITAEDVGEDLVRYFNDRPQQLSIQTRRNVLLEGLRNLYPCQKGEEKQQQQAKEVASRPVLKRADPGVSSAELHQLRRMASHFAEELDDDSQVEQLDTLSLADLNQVLLVTSAGTPRCLSATVFTKTTTGYVKTWSAAATPQGEAFCDNLGIPAEIRASYRNSIEVSIPQQRHSPTSSHADVVHVRYYWTGNTYGLSSDRGIGLEYIPK